MARFEVCEKAAWGWNGHATNPNNPKIRRGINSFPESCPDHKVEVVWIVDENNCRVPVYKCVKE